MGMARGEKGGRVNGKCGSEERRWLCYLNKSLHTLRLDAAINALLAFCLHTVSAAAKEEAEKKEGAWSD